MSDTTPENTAPPAAASFMFNFDTDQWWIEPADADWDDHAPSAGSFVREVPADVLDVYARALDTWSRTADDLIKLAGLDPMLRLSPIPARNGPGYRRRG